MLPLGVLTWLKRLLPASDWNVFSWKVSACSAISETKARGKDIVVPTLKKNTHPTADDFSSEKLWWPQALQQWLEIWQGAALCRSHEILPKFDPLKNCCSHRMNRDLLELPSLIPPRVHLPWAGNIPGIPGAEQGIFPAIPVLGCCRVSNWAPKISGKFWP